MKAVLQPSQFEALRVPFDALRPMFEDICARFSFSFRTAGLGRYPRIRITRLGSPNLFIDLQMDLDEHGEYYDQFFADAPCSMYAGAWIDKGNLRLTKSQTCFHGLPFVRVGSYLQDHLEQIARLLCSWTSSQIEQEGSSSSLTSSR
jgi:hypothetical protein